MCVCGDRWAFGFRWMRFRIEDVGNDAGQHRFGDGSAGKWDDSGIRGSSPSPSITTSLLFHMHPIPLLGCAFAQFVWDDPTSIATHALKTY
ncbi:hypothetical protein D9758_018052 [Tetrapyrgos nigripes]|uniref:Uncharacterized protein n=1 Tax=Tetrapyrgos nigripes TaxID=182062 RepID=A0A8H5F8S8_9AGAR|nr:hypothetical protein D9758_018052 [Tetrapyrgos nigripes]